MTKRKRSKSPKKESALVLHSQQQQSDLFILPNDLLWEILLWGRLDDDDQSIWVWVCRISATCKVFRHLVCMEKKGGVPCSLLPTVFNLLPKNKDYLNEGPNHVRCGFDPSSDTAFLRVELMKAIRSSSWIGAQLKLIHACDNSASYSETRSLSWLIVEELKRLVTSPCLPNLMELKIIHLDLSRGFKLVDEAFLRDMAEQHSGLTTLSLCGFGTPGRGRLTPTAVATFVSSMPHLQKVGFGDSHFDNDKRVFGDEHLCAFLTNLNPNVTSLALDFEDFHPPTRDAIGTLLSTVCPHLESLQVYSEPIRTRQLGRILRLKTALMHVDVSCAYEVFGLAETNDEA